MATGKPWSVEEDRIVLRNTATEDSIQELVEHGFHRTGSAVLSRRKALLKVRNKSPNAIAQERAELETELAELERRLRDVRKRLLEVRIAQVEEAAGDIELPKEVYEAIRKQLSE